MWRQHIADELTTGIPRAVLLQYHISRDTYLAFLQYFLLFLYMYCMYTYPQATHVPR